MFLNFLKNFNGFLYQVHLEIYSDRLFIVLENKSSLENWQCSYTEDEIEKLTRKTGCFKHFKSFLSMLETAFEGTDDSVKIDLLTFEDLKKIKERRFGQCHLKKDKSKLYFVLTYHDHFGSSVHYPLSLFPQYFHQQASQHNHTTALNKQLTKLQKENLKLTTSFKAFKQATEEREKDQKNEILRLKKLVMKLEANSKLYEMIHKSEECKKLRVEVDMLRREERQMKMKIQQLNSLLLSYRSQRSSRDCSPHSLPPFRTRTDMKPSPRRLSSYDNTQANNNYIRSASSPWRKQASENKVIHVSRSSSSPRRHYNNKSHNNINNNRPLSLSSLLDRLTRPTSSSSLKRVERHINTTKSSLNNDLYKRGFNKKKSEYSNSFYSGSVCSFGSYRNERYKHKQHSKERKYSMTSTLTSYDGEKDELKKIDERLKKIKMFLDENL